MIINKDNFEALIIDYIEGRLDKSNESELSYFLEKNGDSIDNYTDLVKYKINDTANITCHFKDTLKKVTPLPFGRINADNYQYIFALYADKVENDYDSEIEEFLNLNPELKTEFVQFAKITIPKENKIFYPNKNKLKYRSKKIILNTFYTISAAASVIIVMGAFLHIFKSSNTSDIELKPENKIVQTDKDNSVKDKTIEFKTENIIEIQKEKTNLAKVENKQTQKNTTSGQQIQQQTSSTTQEETKYNNTIEKITPIYSTELLCQNNDIIHEMIFNENYNNINIHENIIYNKLPKGILNKIFYGIVKIFKESDKDDIRYLALKAISDERQPETTDNQETKSMAGNETGMKIKNPNLTSNKDKKNEFYIFGIYIHKTKAE